jgi:hypothetical protein
LLIAVDGYALLQNGEIFMMMGMKGAAKAMAKAIAEGRVPEPLDPRLSLGERASDRLDKTIATARDAMDQELAATPMKRADHLPITFPAIYLARRAICQAGYVPKDFSLVIPARDFCMLLDDARMVSFKVDGASSGTSAMRVYDIEILRGERGIGIFGPKMIPSNRKALDAEILRCLGRGSVAELPQSASSNGVSPSAKTIGEVRVTTSPASRDNRDSNRTADLSHEAKIIAAKHAIAVYAREKKLPGAEMLAAFGELDRAKASGGVATVGVDLAKPGSDKTAVHVTAGEWQGVVWIDESNMVTPKWIRDAVGDRAIGQINGAPANINRHAHRLSSESLRRAADQIWIGNSGGTYADLVCSRPERLAEMVYRGDSAPDGERG